MALRLAGQVSSGGWLSVMVTLKVHAAVLPLLSVAVQVTGVMPTAKLLPLGGAQARLVTAQLSVALAL